MRNRNRARTSVPSELILLWGALIFASGKSSSAQIRRHALAAAIGAAFALPQAVYALPTGGQVVSGSSAITQTNATTLSINQSTTRSGINWQGFNTASGESVIVSQPAGGVALYRVANPVEFYGRLSATGQIFLSSPGGVLFGAGSMVDVGGIVATTLSMSQANFDAGRNVWTNTGATGSVINNGSISAPNGYVALLGPQVANNGIIAARMGSVALAAGDKITLDMVGDGLIKVTVDEAALNAAAMNKGTIEADGGNVFLTVRSANALLDSVINTDGVIRANSIGSRNGVITLDGGDKGVVSVAGTIEAKGIDAGTTGGTVKVLGEYVGVGLPGTTASINASGDAGGGTVLIGGNYRGQGPEHNSSATFMSSDSTISADAVTSGNGGKVIVWSNDATRAYGSISARGGAQSGDGGFVEVSGRNWLDFAARVDTTAPNGATGTLLLDPTDITIGGGATSGGTCPPAGPCFDLMGDPNSANLNAADLIAALGTSNVTVSTLSGGSGAGDISVATGVSYSSANSLTLRADRDLNMVTFGGSIVSNGAGALRLEAGRDFNLRNAAVLAIAGPLSVSAGGNLNVTAVAQPTLIQASTLDMNVVGGLRVQAGLAPASVSSLNGQTINAGFIEVTAQGNNTADISNLLSGNQLITTSGANAVGEGIVVRNLGGTNNVAMIRQGAAGASQLISVNDADALNVNGIGGNAIISNNGGMQIISVTGATGANAINIGSTGALGASQIVGGSQNITAGASGESGSISIVGSAANARPAGFGSFAGAGNFQTVSTSGTLSVTGGSAPAQLPNTPAGIFHNGTGQQTVTAAAITLQGGLSGNGNSAFISSVGGGNPLASGDQVINVVGGSISLTGGTVGNNNRAGIFSSANQTISGNPNITLTGGASGGAVNLSNSANIASGVNKLQSINAGNISLTSGAGGIDSSATITGTNQLITATGDVTLTGNASGGTLGGARIGGLSGATPGATNLTLNVSGDVVLTGGNAVNNGVAIGSTPAGAPQANNIAITSGGSVILNSGAGSGARIGSSLANGLAGGDIAISASGGIQLNGTAQPTAIRTLGNVTLQADSPGGTISEGTNGLIRANALTTSSNGNTSLTGPNQVAAFKGSSTAGDLSLNNTSTLLTVPEISLAGGGALTLNQAGNLFLSGNVSSGAQTIHASGDLTVAPFGGPGISVSASGAQTISAGGTLSVLGGSAIDGRAVVTGSGPTSVTAGNDFHLAGGSGQNAQALLFSNGDINLTIGGALRLNAGSGENAWARVQTATRDSTINIYFPNLSSGGYFVNDIEGALRRGLTGILSGAGVAVPDQTLDITYGQ